MKILKLIIAALIDTGLIWGSIYLFPEESMFYLILLTFLILVVSLLGYYIIKEKKPIWILIILLLPLSYLGNMGITKIQEKNYNKQMDVLAEQNKVKAQEMTDSLKTLLENNDVKGLKEIYTEESINNLTDKINLKNIKLEKFGEDLEVEPYDTESWGAYGTGNFTYEDTKYYIEYSITGTSEEANYSDITIVPYDLYEKASNITEESDADETNAIYEEIDEKQIYVESIYNTENADLDALTDLEY